MTPTPASMPAISACYKDIQENTYYRQCVDSPLGQELALRYIREYMQNAIIHGRKMNDIEQSLRIATIKSGFLPYAASCSLDKLNAEYAVLGEQPYWVILGDNFEDNDTHCGVVTAIHSKTRETVCAYGYDYQDAKKNLMSTYIKKSDTDEMAYLPQLHDYSSHNAYDTLLSRSHSIAHTSGIPEVLILQLWKEQWEGKQHSWLITLYHRKQQVNMRNQHSRYSHIAIYTDASVNTLHRHAGYGAISTEGNISYGSLNKLGDNAVVNAELYAMKHAIHDIVESYEKGRFIICSDSQIGVSMVKSLYHHLSHDEPVTVKNKSERIALSVAQAAYNIATSSKGKISVRFAWVKGHTDNNPFNDVADRIARTCMRDESWGGIGSIDDTVSTIVQELNSVDMDAWMDIVSQQYKKSAA